MITEKDAYREKHGLKHLIAAGSLFHKTRKMSRTTPFNTGRVRAAGNALLAYKAPPKRKPFFTRLFRGLILRYRKRQRRKIVAKRNLAHDVRIINNAVEELTARMDGESARMFSEGRKSV